MYKKLGETKGAVNEHLVYLIEKLLNKMKKRLRMCLDIRHLRLKRMKIVDIVERILEFNNKIQSGQGLKILTTNQLLSRLPITLAQLKTGNN